MNKTKFVLNAKKGIFQVNFKYFKGGKNMISDCFVKIENCIE